MTPVNTESTSLIKTLLINDSADEQVTEINEQKEKCKKWLRIISGVSLIGTGLIVPTAMVMQSPTMDNILASEIIRAATYLPGVSMIRVHDRSPFFSKGNMMRLILAIFIAIGLTYIVATGKEGGDVYPLFAVGLTIVKMVVGTGIIMAPDIFRTRAGRYCLVESG